MLRCSSSTIATASRRNSGVYFDGRPPLHFLLHMDFLLYEVSVQWGDAHLVAVGQSGAAHDEAPAVVGALGHLGVAVRGVVDVTPVALVDGGDGGGHALG